MPEGGFFLWLPVDDGEAAAVKLWRETGVRVLPGYFVYVPAIVRFQKELWRRRVGEIGIRICKHAIVLVRENAAGIASPSEKGGFAKKLLFPTEDW